MKPCLKVKAAISAMLAATALAQASEFTVLSKEEVQSEIINKKSVHIRDGDGQRVQWDIRDNGTVYGRNLSRNTSDTARWELKEDGLLCLKWRGNSQDTCVYHIRDNGTLFRSESRNPDAPRQSKLVEIN